MPGGFRHQVAARKRDSDRTRDLFSRLPRLCRDHPDDLDWLLFLHASRPDARAELDGEPVPELVEPNAIRTCLFMLVHRAELVSYGGNIGVLNPPWSKANLVLAVLLQLLSMLACTVSAYQLLKAREVGVEAYASVAGFALLLSLLRLRSMRGVERQLHHDVYCAPTTAVVWAVYVLAFIVTRWRVAGPLDMLTYAVALTTSLVAVVLTYFGLERARQVRYALSCVKVVRPHTGDQLTHTVTAPAPEQEVPVQEPVEADNPTEDQPLLASGESLELQPLQQERPPQPPPPAQPPQQHVVTRYSRIVAMDELYVLKTILGEVVDVDAWRFNAIAITFVGYLTVLVVALLHAELSRVMFASIPFALFNLTQHAVPHFFSVAFANRVDGRFDHRHLFSPWGVLTQLMSIPFGAVLIHYIQYIGPDEALPIDQLPLPVQFTIYTSIGLIGLSLLLLMTDYNSAVIVLPKYIGDDDGDDDDASETGSDLL